MRKLWEWGKSIVAAAISLIGIYLFKKKVELTISVWEYGQHTSNAYVVTMTADADLLKHFQRIKTAILMARAQQAATKKYREARAVQMFRDQHQKRWQDLDFVPGNPIFSGKTATILVKVVDKK